MFWDLIKYKNININMKNFFTLWFVLSLVLCSCNSGGGYESGFYGNVLEHVVAKDSTLLTGDEVPELSDFVSSHSFVSMRCVGEYLLFYTYGTDTVFTVFNMNGWREAGKLFPNGMGKGKLYSPLLCGVIGRGSHSGELSLYDSKKYMSLDLGKALVSDMPKLNVLGLIPDYIFSAMFKDDSTNIVQTLVGDNNTRMFLYLSAEGNVKDSVEIYRGTLNSQYTTFQSFDAISADGCKIAMAMSSVPAVGIFDTKEKSCRFVTPVNDFPDMEDLVDSGNYMDTRYYEDVSVDDEYIYCVYCDEEPYVKEIHVFDWDGAFIHRFKVKELISSISVDAENGYLYSLTEDHKVYRYDVSM